jgi:glycosyltransferase involved in cell wall biosynthesis
MTELSVVIPIFNEELGVEPLVKRLTCVLKSITGDYEIIFVNDGSSDSTKSKVTDQIKLNSKIRLINLAKNYGHMEALSVGLQVSRGDYVVTMDGDLQHPPEAITEMYSLIKSNLEIEVIQGVRTDRRGDTFFKKATASLFYGFSSRITGVPVIHHAADFRIMSRNCVEVINSLQEKSKILRFLIPELGFKIEAFQFVCEERFSGKSKYNFRKMFSFAFDSIISFSTKPLRIMSIIGFTLSAFFMMGTIVTFIVWFVAKTVPGWTSIFMLLLTSNALVLGSLGLLGEYVSKIREATMARPHSRWKE